MGKMSELSTVVDELRKCGETLIDIGNTLGDIFGEGVRKDVPAPTQERIQAEPANQERIQQEAAQCDNSKRPMPQQVTPQREPTQPDTTNQATHHVPTTEQTAPWEATQPEPAQPQPASQPQPPQVTLEQLRGVLAEKSVGGHRAEVQALIREYGADKLSAVNPKYYADMLAKAEAM